MRSPVRATALPDAGAVALRDAVGQRPRLHFPQPRPRVCPSDDKIAALARILNETNTLTILAGACGAGAHTELIFLFEVAVD